MHPSFQEEPTVMFAPRFYCGSYLPYGRLCKSYQFIFRKNSFIVLAVI